MIRSISEIDHIVIHCANTPNGSQRWTILDIDDWHRERGFKRDQTIRLASRPHLNHVGYHLVVNPDGSVARGRSIAEVGAHARGVNTRSIGICLIGTDRYTRPAWIALREAIEEIQDELDREIKIIGHNEISHKDCPGFSVGHWLDGGMMPLKSHTCELKR